MRRALLLCGLLGVAPAGFAWEFGPALTVAPPAEGVFHHLEAAGRASLAVSAAGAVLTWEDNRDGRPTVWAAWRTGAGGFTAPQRVSGGTAAYEPAVSAFGEGAVFAWEEDGAVRVRTGSADGLGPVLRVGGDGAGQPSLAAAPQGGAYLVWVEPAGRHRRAMFAHLRQGPRGLEAQAPRPVEAGVPAGDQLYPAVAATSAGAVVAWEDRRHGHTRLYHAFAPRGGAFEAPRTLNELVEARSAEFGRGTGVTRVSLAADGHARVLATWMDKRNFEGGYKVYAALSEDGGRRFGANEEVQDPFGDNVPQWHPDVALSPGGDMAVAWDDRRDETADLWLSWRGADGTWSDDLAVSPGHGPGEQSHPVLAFDAQGVLHLAWVSRGAQGTAVRYARAQRD